MLHGLSDWACGRRGTQRPRTGTRTNSTRGATPKQARRRKARTCHERPSAVTRRQPLAGIEHVYSLPMRTVVRRKMVCSYEGIVHPKCNVDQAGCLAGELPVSFICNGLRTLPKKSEME
eukprot:scaffold263924_cov31-Tisochrysis_lutea.AAC.2